MPVGPRGHARAYLALAGGLAGVYALLWASISALMERTFSLSVWDVGANFVLTNMTSPPGLDYGHLKFAPQNLIYLAFTPLTRAFPDPMTLVYAEDLLMGVGGVFIYLIAAEAWGSRPRALLVEGLYLFNYSLFGAAFFPNHYEILFSVFFPIAYYLHLTHRPAGAAVFLILAALTSSLGAIMAGLFVVLLLGPRLLAELRGHGLGVRRFLADQRFAFGAGIAALAIFLLPFAIQGSGVTLSYAHLQGNPSSPSLLGGLTNALPEKLIGLALVAVPFLPVIHRSRYVLLVVPYMALALVSGLDHYTMFSYQYLYVIGAVLFIAWIEALRFRYASVPLPRARPRRRRRTRLRARLWRLPGAISREPELFQMTAIVVGAGFFLLPFGPGNAWAGGYYSLPFRDYDLPTLLTVTPYDQALWNMVGSVPMNASVLIQENMPALTSRATWFEPGSYDGEPVQYALADPSSFWFYHLPPLFIGPYTTPMISWVDGLIENQSYGAVQEYKGAMLLERGYQGRPVPFVPWETYNPGVAFVGPNATYPGVPPGVVHVPRLASGAGLLHTEAPLILPPGHYTLTYWLSAKGATSSDRLTAGLWTNQTSPQGLETRQVTGANLSKNGAWTEVTLSFSLPGYVDGVYFGLSGGWNDGLSLASVYLNQSAPE
jgi:hypothetical protein